MIIHYEHIGALEMLTALFKERHLFAIYFIPEMKQMKTDLTSPGATRAYGPLISRIRLAHPKRSRRIGLPLQWVEMGPKRA